MKVRVSKWGDSLAVRIPKSIADTAGLREGSELDLTVTETEVRLKRSRYSLESLLQQVTSENLHAEFNAGGWSTRIEYGDGCEIVQVQGSDFATSGRNPVSLPKGVESEQKTDVI